MIFDFGLKAKTHHNIHNKMILITAVTMPKKSKQTIRNKKAAASKKLAAAREQVESQIKAMQAKNLGPHLFCHRHKKDSQDDALSLRSNNGKE